MPDPEIEEVISFCRALREHGLSVTPSEALDAVMTIGLIDTGDREETFLSWRSMLTTRVEDFPIFEQLFEAFWNRSPEKIVSREASSSATLRARPSAPKYGSHGIALLLEQRMNSRRGDTGEEGRGRGASDAPSDSVKDFGRYGAQELEAMMRLTRRIVKRLARNPSRRWKPVRKGSRVDLRRSFRHSLKTGGEFLQLTFRERKRKRTKLVVICDVSGSMDPYSRLLLQFVYGLQNSFARVETFVFSTALSRITGHLKNRTYPRALDRLTSRVQGWSGGTLIGASIAAFNAGWLRLVDQRTIVLILSDGWDTGEPERLAGALASLKKRAARVIWLNPLMGDSSYRPVTRGMQAALPLIDILAPAHDLASLRKLEPHLIL